MPDRLSPLHDLHAAAGASFTDFAGWQMPVSYGSDLAEHRAVRTAAGLFDISHMGEILVMGPDAAVALDYALAGNLSAIDDFQAKYTFMLTPEGGIVDDLIVYRTARDRFLVVANAGNRLAVAAELLSRCAAFDCEVFDESDEIALIAIQGPKALEILSQTWVPEGGSALDAPDASGPAVDVPGLAELGYYRCAPGTFGEHELLVARTGYTGEDGFELYLAPEAAPALWEALLATGAGSGLIACGLAARDTLRLEAGMPLYGHELSLETQPAQAGLGRAVPLRTKTADFVGRTALEEAPPPERTLVGLVTEGKRAGRAEYPVFVAAVEGAEPPSEPVGIITSGALSPTLGHPIAMAYVDVSAVGDPLAIDVRGTRIPASVVPLPFYKREAL